MVSILKQIDRVAYWISWCYYDWSKLKFNLISFKSTFYICFMSYATKWIFWKRVCLLLSLCSSLFKKHRHCSTSSGVQTNFVPSFEFEVLLMKNVDLTTTSVQLSFILLWIIRRNPHKCLYLEFFNLSYLTSKKNLTYHNIEM